MSIFQQRKTRSKFISFNLHGLYSPRYVSNATISAEGAYVGLAAPGEAGSWQLESKVTKFCIVFRTFWV
jgi:hypothetical protein